MTAARRAQVARWVSRAAACRCEPGSGLDGSDTNAKRKRRLLVAGRSRSHRHERRRSRQRAHRSPIAGPRDATTAPRRFRAHHRPTRLPVNPTRFDPLPRTRTATDSGSGYAISPAGPSFDSKTGELRGTPGGTQVGTLFRTSRSVSPTCARMQHCRISPFGSARSTGQVNQPPVHRRHTRRAP